MAGRYDGVTLRDLIQPDAAMLDEPQPSKAGRAGMVAVCGLAAYGFSVGYWRSPMMGCYVAVKMPLLVLCTLGCNALLNGLLGLLLGSGLGFRQSSLALLMAFALAALILGSLAPVTFFLAWNAPEPTSAHAAQAHATYLVAHTFLIGFAGIVANLHLHRLLAARAPSQAIANVTLLAWLGGNGFLGAQFAWIFRPFFGSPNLEIAFLRKDAMRGNFYHAVWNSISRMSDLNAAGNALVLCLLILLIGMPVIFSLRNYHKSSNRP